MLAVNNIGFIGYAVFVFAITGLLLLLADVKAYKHAGLKRERKVAKILGWTNIIIGTMMMLANWIYQELSW